MRKFFWLLWLPLVMLTACTRGTEEPEEVRDEPPPAGARTYWHGLRMYVAQDGVTPTTMRLSMINDDAELYFGHGLMFSIEQYTDGGWARVPTIGDVFFPLPLMIIPPLVTVDENISWGSMYGALPPGQYRVVRHFSIEDMRSPTRWREREGYDAYLYAPFEIVDDWQTAHADWQRAQDALAAIAYARFDGLDLALLAYSPYGLEHWIYRGWEFDTPTRLQPGEYIFMEVDWYDQIGALAAHGRYPFNENIFDLVVNVALDVDEAYIRENFRHIFPGLPLTHYQVRALFELIR